MREIKIDFDNPGFPQRLDVVENDAQSRFFKAVLYKDGKEYTAPDGTTYSIMYRGFGPQNEGWYDTINDGAGKRAACSVSGNVVTCEIARQALRVPGHVSVMLCVTGSNGYMLHGWPIDCNCRNDSYTGGTSVESFFYITQVTNADWSSAIQTWEELKNMIDPTLSVEGKAADAAKVGEAINAESERAKGAEKQIKEDLVDKTKILNNIVEFGNVNKKVTITSDNYSSLLPNANDVRSKESHILSEDYAYKNGYYSDINTFVPDSSWKTFKVSTYYGYTYNITNVSESGGFTPKFIGVDINGNKEIISALANTSFYNTKYIYVYFTEYNTDTDVTLTIASTYNTIYTLNFASGMPLPLNLPIDKSNGSVTNLITIQSNYLTQYYIDQYQIYQRNTLQDFTVWSKWRKIVNSFDIPITILVDKSGAGDYTSLTKAINYAIAKKNTTVIVNDGEYDIEDEFIEEYGSTFFDNPNNTGLVLKNDVHLIFSSNSKVVFNYSGTNTTILTLFSPFNIGGSATIENLSIETSRCRYCIHEDLGAITGKYEVKYIGCNFKMDNRDNEQWKAKQCIGGGLGANGYVTITDCYFNSFKSDDEEWIASVTYHNDWSETANGKCNVVIKNNYFGDHNGLSLRYHGITTKISNFIVTNNSLAHSIEIRPETSTDTIVNIEVKQWNNDIRVSKLLN